MSWTPQKPQLPGWYWAKSKSGVERIICVRLATEQDHQFYEWAEPGMLVEETDEGMVSECDYVYYAGPIPKP